MCQMFVIVTKICHPSTSVSSNLCSQATFPRLRCHRDNCLTLNIRYCLAGFLLSSMCIAGFLLVHILFIKDYEVINHTSISFHSGPFIHLFPSLWLLLYTQSSEAHLIFHLPAYSWQLLTATRC